MAYYKWRGINLAGSSCSGSSYAHTLSQLEARLLKKDIAVLAAKETQRPFFGQAITLEHRVAFLRHLAVLLDAGVHIPHALRMLSEQAEPLTFQEVLQEMALAVEHGAQLSTALKNYPTIFDPLTIQMVQVGQESGSLAHSLEQTCDYLEQRQKFYQQVKSAAVMPILTFVVFFAIAIVIFVLVIPRFASMFKSMRKQVPPVTAIMLKISEFMTNNWVALLGVAMLVVGFIVAFARSPKGKETMQAIAARLPLIGPMLTYSSVVYFLRSLTMLLESGLPVLPALNIIIKNSPSTYATQLSNIEQSVEGGSALSQAMASGAADLFPEDVQAMVKVGEESGRLSSLLAKAADLYAGKVQRQLTIITTLVQPLLMVVLGLLITALIFAVYVPIFNIAEVI